MARNVTKNEGTFASYDITADWFFILLPIAITFLLSKAVRYLRRSSVLSVS
jgi:hypothetical protein